MTKKYVVISEQSLISTSSIQSECLVQAAYAEGSDKVLTNPVGDLFFNSSRASSV